MMETRRCERPSRSTFDRMGEAAAELPACGTRQKCLLSTLVGSSNFGMMRGRTYEG